MRKNIYNKKIIKYVIGISFLIFLFHIFAFYYDKNLINNDREPFFSIKTGGLKDGGTTFYYGLGYQIIQWNVLKTKNLNGKDIYGVEHGFEIHRFPFFIDWKDGPTIPLEFRQAK